MRTLRYALELYYNNTASLYPTCLKAGGSCTTVLDGAGTIPAIPVDPLSGVNYSYAALGTCGSFHLGASLEVKSNPALLSDADSATTTICSGSYPDFSGLSYAAGGQPCNTTAGIAQPTGAANGGSCYDVKP